MLADGARVGSWVVEGELGRGAMATVYAARHAELGTPAALKVLDRVDAASKGSTLEERLLAEGRAQGGIAHPGVVGVFDLIRAGDHAALVLERVDGGDLRVLLAAGPIPLPEALDLFRQIAEAIGAAHAAGLVHRDIKPSNVLLTRRDGRWVAKVGDFGLVKTLDGDLTATHAMLGTPRYMAPEQMRAARRVDARADVFALGAVLYELVTGRATFSGDDLVALYADKVGGRYPAPQDLVPDLPLGVIAAIRGALAPDPAHRIPSCEALLGVLDGGAWAAPADATLDGGPAIAICPSCTTPGTEELCAACGAPTTLSGRFRLLEGGPDEGRALDLRSGEVVAVRSVRVGAPEAARFERGAALAVGLDHPGVARGVVPPFVEHGRIWAVSTRPEGPTLAEHVRTRRPSEAEIRTWLGALCEPLGYLATRTPPVVHGGVSADRVVVGPGGRLVLVDFARARLGGADGSLHDVRDAAPEQWVGEATPASDVYGLGALAHTLLVGEPATGRRWARGAVSPGLRALVDAMLADDPGARPTPAEVAARLSGVREAALARRRRATGFAFVPLAALGAAAVVAVVTWMGVFGLSYLAFTRFQRDAAPAPLRIPPPIPLDDPSLPVGPSRAEIRLPGPDLADRRPPGADCGAPFEVTVQRAEGDPSAAPLFAVRCDGRVEDLGPVGPSEPTAVRLSGIAGLTESTLRSSLFEPPKLVWIRGAVPSASPVVVRGVRPAAVDVPPAAGGGRVFPARMDGWATGAEGRPDLSRPLHLDRAPWLPASAGAGPERLDANTFASLRDRDGVFRAHRYDFLAGARVVDGAAAVRELLVHDARGPIADAEVQCLPGVEASATRTVHARTDEEGLVRCGAAGAPHAWATIQAPGFVARTTQLVDGTLRVGLEPARPVWVGCAGFAGDRCDTMDVPPVCAGGRGASGICRFVGEGLRCDCATDADRLEHDTWGTVRLGTSDGVWFDLRALEGGVTGQIVNARGRCRVRLASRGARGLVASTDGEGRYRFDHVPVGSYAVVANCSGPEKRLADVTVTAEAPQVEVARQGAPPVATIVSTPRPEVPEEDLEERKLVDYAFPTLPPGLADGEKRVMCELTVRIGEDGRLVDAKRTELCREALEPHAIAALRGWRWAPGRRVTSERIVVPFRVPAR